MKQQKKKWFLHLANIVTVALIIECFLCALMLVRKYARENCFDRIQETTIQTSDMLEKSLDVTQQKLMMFADILAANSTNPDELLQVYMENFCTTGDFSSVCIHRANGTSVAYGSHHHETVAMNDFAEEVQALPYISEVHSNGPSAKEKYFYQAVPIIRNESTVGILYGYISLDSLPEFVSTTAYNGACQLYIVDGLTGDFLMDTWHSEMLGNIYDGSMGDRETKDGFDMNQMRDGVKNGESGFFIFRSKTTGEWFYTYYMPTGINNWSFQLTIDEPTAFESYNEITFAILVLSVCVIVLMVIHVFALMIQTAQINKKDKERLKKSKYMYEVQRALLNAHNNPNYIDQALKTVADEVKAETVLLMSFSDRVINDIYYWPSIDKTQVMKLAGRKIRDDFPVLYDMLSTNQSVLYYKDDGSVGLSEIAKKLFTNMDLTSMMLVPIMDTSGLLKGAICAANFADKKEDCELLECLTYDFFMAIANMENHAIIKNMGTMDYLTKMKNRNSYETELHDISTQSCKNLWCIFIDANGLHELNNKFGHKAGDQMLCTVANAVKRIFNSTYSYRTGGDEFVTFLFDCSSNELEQKKARFTCELTSKGYSAAIGYACVENSDQGVFDMDNLLRDAEMRMYQDKKTYYKTHHLSLERDYGIETMESKNKG